MELNGIDQDNDLGFSLSEDANETANLFALFAAGQTEDTPKPVDVKPTAEETPKSETPKNDKPDASSKETEKEEPTVDTDAVRKLIEQGGTEDAPEGEDKDKTKTQTKDAATEGEDSVLSVVFNDFKENGILDVPEDFEFDGTEESLKEAVELTLQNRLEGAVEATIEDAFQKNPAQADVAKDFIKHLGMGGTVTDFVASRKDMGIKVENLDSEDEAVRTKTADTILSSYYRDVMKWPEDKIKRQLERAAAKGDDIKVDEARDVWEEYQATMKEKRDKLLETTKANDVARQQQIAQFNTNLATAIDTADEVAGVKLTSKKQREELKDYLFKPTVDVNGKKVPQYLADRNRLMNDPKFVMAQAMFLRNGMKPDTKAVETKVAGSLEKRLSDLQKGKKTAVATGQGTENKDRSTPGFLDFENMEVITI